LACLKLAIERVPSQFRLKLSRQLRDRARFDQDQAEGLAEAAFQEQVATKADILLLQNELKLLEQRITIKMGAMLAAAIGILLALEKLIK
jgi:hypothetical protein